MRDVKQFTCSEVKDVQVALFGVEDRDKGVVIVAKTQAVIAEVDRLFPSVVWPVRKRQRNPGWGDGIRTYLARS